MSDDSTRTSIVHMCLDIRGAMRWSRRQLGQMFRRDDGSYASADEAFEFLADELAKGHRVLPMGNPCPGFNYETGCPGHPQEKAGRR